MIGDSRLSQEGEAGQCKPETQIMPELVTLPDVPDQFAKLTLTETAIAELVEASKSLKIDGITDTEGYTTVRTARMKFVKVRTTIEATRKELKAPSVTYGKAVDAEARRLTALGAPTEAHLLGQQQAVDDEKKRILEEARRKAEAEEQARVEAEEAEKQRLADEEAARVKAIQNAENERLRVARADLERDRAELDEEKARLDEQARVARAVEEKAALARSQAAAVEAVRLRDEAAARRREELRPDCEKLLTVAAAIASLSVPEVSEAAEETRYLVLAALMDAEEQIRNIVKAMA